VHQRRGGGGGGIFQACRCACPQPQTHDEPARARKASPSRQGPLAVGNAWFHGRFKEQALLFLPQRRMPPPATLAGLHSCWGEKGLFKKHGTLLTRTTQEGGERTPQPTFTEMVVSARDVAPAAYSRLHS
jgi:hypothetical protein